MKVSFLNDHTDCYILKTNKLTINILPGFLMKNWAEFYLVITHGFGSNSRLTLNFALQHKFKVSFWHYNVRYRIMRFDMDSCKHTPYTFSKRTYLKNYFIFIMEIFPHDAHVIRHLIV